MFPLSLNSVCRSPTRLGGAAAILWAPEMDARGVREEPLPRRDLGGCCADPLLGDRDQGRHQKEMKTRQLPGA